MAGVLSIPIEDLGNEKSWEKIGEGGYSTVFKTTWSGREVAVKRQHKVERRELEILAKLDHPHIVKLLAYVPNEANFSLVLELCERGTARQELNRLRATGQSLTKHRRNLWSLQAISAIGYLHENNVQHRDIKSSNFLITQENNVKLTDFRLSKAIGLTYTMSDVRGTHAYMAPEMWEEEHASPRSDIYAFGIFVWELITLEVPFKGVTYPTIMYIVVDKNERPPIPSDCSTEIRDLLERCWKKDRYQRPQPSDIIEILSRLQDIDMMDVTVETKRDTQIIQTRSSDSIRYVKKCIEQKTGLEIQKQRLTYQDRVLDDMDATVSLYEIIEGSVLHLDSPVTLRMPVASEEMTLQMDWLNNIADVKEEIMKRRNIPIRYQSVSYQGATFADSRQLASLGFVTDHTECRLDLECHVFVKSRTGDSISIAVSTDDAEAFKISDEAMTVEDLKKLLEEQKGIPETQQVLFYDGDSVPNSTHLCHIKEKYGIVNLLLLFCTFVFLPIFISFVFLVSSHVPGRPMLTALFSLGYIPELKDFVFFNYDPDFTTESDDSQFDTTELDIGFGDEL
ncbi:mitogen-activated protein kinase kinase kinase 12-like [Amphiura filiformis]|uniref:mitogen-activated protein kinase kinase kinase 12-like n=1 Tax=Amphiura filiformis TaxID=82378 RepID=UPI003B220599